MEPLDHVKNTLHTLDTITSDFKSCLESTERAVSAILTNSSTRPTLQSSPSPPPHRRRLRKVLHLSHKRFKRLIIAQHQEIVKLRKTLASPPKNTAHNAPTPSSSSMLATPKNISEDRATTSPTTCARPPTAAPVPPTTPVSKSVNKQHQLQTLRKRVIGLLKRHRTLSARLTGNKSQDVSTLVELRSLTAQLLDLGIKVPLTGPNNNNTRQNTVLSTPTTNSADEHPVPSTTTSSTEEDEDTKHFEYLFAKIMAGPTPKPPKPPKETESKNVSLSSAVQQQLFASTPSPGRRRANVLRSNQTTKPLCPTSSQTVQTSFLQSISTPPRTTGNSKLSPRNPTPGSRKRARIAARGDGEGDRTSFDAVLRENTHFYAPSSDQQLEPQSEPQSEKFVPTALEFSSPSSFESKKKQGGHVTRVLAKKQHRSNTFAPCSEGHTPPRLFVRTPPHRNGTRRQTGHLIHPPTMSSLSSLEQRQPRQQRQPQQPQQPQQQQQQQREQQKQEQEDSARRCNPENENIRVDNSNEYTTQQQQQQDHLEEILENAMVGSPFPPMSPILEPVDRSAIFAPDDIMSDLHVVKTLNMIGGKNNGPKRISSSPPVNGLMPRKHHHHQQSRTSSYRSTPSIPFVDARPRTHRTASPTAGENDTRGGGGNIPFVRRICSPKLNNKINLRNSIRLARQSIKK